MARDLNDDEAAELAELLQEASLSDFERRKRRLEAASKRLGDGIVLALQKARFGGTLTQDEFIVSHLGFLPGEVEAAETGGNA